MFDFEDWDDPDGDGKMDQVKDSACASARDVDGEQNASEAAGLHCRQDEHEDSSFTNAAKHDDLELGETNGARQSIDSTGQDACGGKHKPEDTHARSDMSTTTVIKDNPINNFYSGIGDQDVGLTCTSASFKGTLGSSDGTPSVDDLRWTCPACDEPNRSDRSQCNNCCSQRPVNGVRYKVDQAGSAGAAAMGDGLSSRARQMEGSQRLEQRSDDHGMDGQIANVRALLVESKVQPASELIEKLLNQRVSKLESFELRKLHLEAMLHPAWRHKSSSAGSSSRVLQMAEGLMQEQPTDTSLPALLGRALCGEGRRKDADVVWERAASKETHDGVSRRLLRCLAVAEAEKKTGNIAFKEAKWKEACQAYTRALEADSMRVDSELAAVILGNRSAAERKLGRFRSAFDDADESVRMAPTYVRARFRRALTCMELGKYPEALQDLKSVEQQEPNTSGLNEWLLRAQHWNSKKQMNHYAVLEATMDATAEELKRAHKRVILQWHPDKAAASGASKEECEAKFRAAQQAFEFLSDDKRRELYDFGGPRPVAPSPTSATAGTSSAKYGPMPKSLVAQGWGPMAKGDGRTTCLLCGDFCESISEKKWHMFGEGHNGGFYAS